MLKETFLHTRMLQWHWVGIMHWFVYAAFLFLSTAVLAAYFQLFDADLRAGRSSATGIPTSGSASSSAC